MRVSEYAALDSVGLAELIRAGEVTASEVQEAARRAIEQINPQLNALVAPVFEKPLAYDERGPFAGVPFALKDIGSHAKGVPQGMGTRLTGPGVVFDADTHLMERFRRAGLATLCRTSTPEFGFNFSTEPARNGPTRNPWNTAHSPGGSSGGSAALVAARALPLAHANDGAGSIRCPAAWCGLVGLKPSRGRIPTGPGQAEPILGYGVEFVLTRTIRDAAAMLDAVAGPEIGERFVVPTPPRPYLEETQRQPKRLRIAVMTRPWNGARVDEAHVKAVERVARELEQAGHVVAEARPEIDNEAFDSATARIWGAVTSHWILTAAKLSGRPPDHDSLEAVSLATLSYGRTLSALDVLDAQDIVNALTRQVARWFVDYDVLVSPTMATPPPPLGHLNMQDASLNVRGWWNKMSASGPFTALWNMVGAPALSLPLGAASSGPPVGVQLVGRYLDEATLLALGAYLEKALPWNDARPAVCAG